MLYFKDQLNIAFGLVATYSDERNEISLTIKSNKNRFEKLYNWKKFSNFSKSKFILFCIWFITKYNILSFNDFVTKSKYYDKKEFEKFITYLKIYKIKTKEEIKYLQNKYGNLIKNRFLVLNEYIKGNINFITLYSVYKNHLDELKKMRSYRLIYKKLNFFKITLKFEDIDVEYKL